MNTFVLASLALALVLTVLALVRQVRLRRALEKLLKVILARWRSHAPNNSTACFIRTTRRITSS